MAESTERELYGDLRAITGHQKSKFLLYFESSCIVITRSRKLARVITSKSVVKNSVLPSLHVVTALSVLIAKTEKCKIKKFTGFTVWLNACSTSLHVYKKIYLQMLLPNRLILIPLRLRMNQVNDPIENEQLQAPILSAIMRNEEY